MRKTKLLLLAAFVVAITALLPGCSIFRKRTADLNKSSFSQTSESSVKSDSSVKKTDKTITVEREKADTTASTPERKINTSNNFDLAGLIKGLTTVDSNLVSVTLTLDTASNKLKTEVVLKPQKVNLKFDKSKTTYNDKTEETKASTQKQNKEAVEVKSKVKKTVAEPKGLAWLWGIVVAVVIIIVIGLLVYFNKFKNIKKSPG